MRAPILLGRSKPAICKRPFRHRIGEYADPSPKISNDILGALVLLLQGGKSILNTSLISADGAVKATGLNAGLVGPQRRRMKSPFHYFNSSPEVIRLTVMLYIHYPLSLRQVEDVLFERGIDLCHETVRF